MSDKSNNSDKNWYVRMHDSSPVSEKPKISDKLNLSIFFRMWLTVAFIMVIAGVVVFRQLFEYIEPTSKQIIEDTLVDTSKLLAVALAQPLDQGRITSQSYQDQLDKAFNQTNISYINRSHDELDKLFSYKNYSDFRVYITDNKGIVLYDSLPNFHNNSIDNLPLNENAEGKDYSKWNDVYLTLQGKYGARSSGDDQQDARIMYVAQPIYNAQRQIIGVVSVGKPTDTVLPYIQLARQQMVTTFVVVVLLAIVFAGVIAWWLRESIALVIRYTGELASDTAKPNFYFGRELNELTDSIETMKHRLENKGYVTDYVHTLTHELKSPLTAIKASGELLADSDLDDEDRQTLSDTINEQSQKLQSLIDRLLLLAKVEQPTFQLNNQLININQLLKNLLDNQQAIIIQRDLQVQIFYNTIECQVDEINYINAPPKLMADSFWLSQALNNILENAVYFARHSLIICLQDLSTKQGNYSLQLDIINDGQLIPEYALDKVFDRYFSLSHQVNNRKKGTGLGLPLAKQVIEHHGGQISIANSVLSNYLGECEERQVVVVSVKI